MSISRDRIAEISPWKNNCAVACIGDFVAAQFLLDKLSRDAMKKLRRILATYYELDQLNNQDLITLLSDQKYFYAPRHHQEILGCAFRDYLRTLDPQEYSELAAHDGQLYYGVFKPFAEAFEFDARFYTEQVVNDQNKIVLVDDQSCRVESDSKDLFPCVPLDVLCHNHHYDSIAPTAEEAKKHNAVERKNLEAFDANNDRFLLRDLPRDDESAMKKQIQQAIAEIKSARLASAPSAKPQAQVVAPSSVSSDFTQAVQEIKRNVQLSEYKENAVPVRGKVRFFDYTDKQGDVIKGVSEADQIKLDELLARELQAEENKKTPRRK